MLAWLQANWGIVFAGLFALDQILASIPVIKANSVFQLVTNLLLSVKPSPPAP